MKRWFLNLINSWNPWQCTICHRKSKDWADRLTFVGRYVWADHALYEGKTEEMYCPEHTAWMPVPQGGREAHRRFTQGRNSENLRRAVQ